MVGCAKRSGDGHAIFLITCEFVAPNLRIILHSEGKMWYIITRALYFAFQRIKSMIDQKNLFKAVESCRFTDQ